MIKGYQTFSFLGYTFSENKPTYYFKEGRYTQYHDDADNTGWHPSRKVHYGSNVLEATIDQFEALDDTELDAFIKDFAAGKYESTSHKAVYYEISFDEAENKWYQHPSRSKLIRPGDINFILLIMKMQRKKF